MGGPSPEARPSEGAQGAFRNAVGGKEHRRAALGDRRDDPWMHHLPADRAGSAFSIDECGRSGGGDAEVEGRGAEPAGLEEE
jgi:hypothetical protein